MKTLWLARSVALLALTSNAGLRAEENGDAGWTTRAVPGAWERGADGFSWYRCWVKVPDSWANLAGRDLWFESVTIGVEKVADAHEVFVNGRRIGGAGAFPPSFERGFAGIHRYKVPPGSLAKAQWNEIALRVYKHAAAAEGEGVGGFLGRAPSIQGYFLECVFAGDWEFRFGDDPGWLGGARAEKPARAAFDQFAEASGILGEAETLMPGRKLPPEESLKRMRPEADLAVDELLTEPVVAQPTHLSFDSRGRLWVSQYRQYPYPSGLKMISRDKYYRAKYDPAIPLPPPNHHRGRSRVSIHEDTDGDGSYDRHKVFLDGLDLANAALPDHDGVWVMHTPFLLFYPDADLDDVPDGDPVVHLAGFGFEDAHSVANGLLWGPDGWIYGGQGSTVASRIVRPGIDPKGAPGVYFEGCMVWRYQPQTRTFEIFAEGGGNVFGLEFDSDGQLFSGHNGGDTRGWHYVQGGYLLKQGRSPNKFGPPANPFAFGDLPAMRGGKISRFSHNTIVCEGSALPERMRGRLLAADPLHHYLVLSERKLRGATFETRDLGFPLRSEDEGFRPVYLTNAPDGSIYLADFYEQYIAHGQHYQSQIDPSTGRVYRLRGKGLPLLQDIDLSRMDSAALIGLLDHPNKWHRQTAVRLLGNPGAAPNLKAQLLEWIRKHRDRAAADGLWALYQSGGFGEDIAVELLHHPHATVRLWTVRLLGDTPTTISGGSADEIRRLARTEKDRHVWSQIASTAQRLPAEQAMPILGELLGRAGELDDPYLPLMFWWAIEKHCDDVGREHVLKLFETREVWHQAGVAREILPRLMRRFALQGRQDDLIVCAQLLRLAPDAARRQQLMRGFEQAYQGGSLPTLPDELLAALHETGAATLLVRVRSGEVAAIREALAIAGDPKADAERRLRYIRAFGEIDASHAEGARGILLGIVKSESAPALRKAALTALQRDSSPEIAEAVLSAYPTLAADEKVAAQLLLASRPAWARAWLEALGRGAVPAGGVAAEAIATLRGYPEDARLAELVTKHFGTEQSAPLPPTPQRVAQVRAIIEQAPGSPYRGRPLFKQLCYSCHVLFYKGGTLEHLTSYQRDDLDTMLTSILDPDAEIREGFEAVSVSTRDGRTLTGFITDRGTRNLVVRGFDGSDLTLQQTNVADTKPLGRSLMPAGLLDGLSDQQIRDLFAYLRISQPFVAD